MHKSTEEFFDRAVEKRVDFVTFLQTTGIHDLMKSYIASLKLASPNWLGGSQSWAHWERNLPKKDSLTRLQKASLLAGNADFFAAHNTVEGCQQIIQQLYPVAVAIRDECNRMLSNRGYNVRINKFGFSKHQSREFHFDDTPMSYELFPSYVITLTVHAKVLPNTTIQTRSMKEAVYEPVPHDGADIAYFEVFHMPQIDLKKFSEAYLQFEPNESITYLSPLGLITFALLIGVSRLDKGFDIDTQRKLAFFASLVSSSKEETYNTVLDTYRKIFGKSNIYDELFVDKLNIETLGLYSPEMSAMLEVFEEWLVEKLRPSINSFIVDMNKRIMEETNDKAFMFIAGGDAMRRYKNSITVTKDIDTKVYVDNTRKRLSTTTTSLEKKVATIIETCMSKLIYYLGTHKPRVFGIQNMIQFHMKQPQNGVMAGIEYYTSSPKNMQFRLRRIRKNPSIPVTLYSLDYRGYVQGTLNGKPFVFKHEVPILDVVIEENKKHLPRSDVVYDSTNEIPVASLKFLLNDLKNTYETHPLAILRAWRNKKQKDLQRFRKLRNIYKGQDEKTTSRGSASDLDVIDPVYSDFIDGVNVDWYVRMFNEIKASNKRKFKHKMPFDFQIILDHSKK